MSNGTENPAYDTFTTRPNDCETSKTTADVSRDTLDKDSTGRQECLQGIRDNLLIILSLVGVVIGFAIGFGIRPLNPSEDAMLWIGLPGEMFMRMLTFTILPLVVSSVLAGTASLDPKSNGKISSIALLYIVVTNTAGVLVGAAVYFAVRPGDGVQIQSTIIEQEDTNLQAQDLFLDLIRNLFPDNIVTACFETTQTIYIPRDVIKLINGTNTTVEEFVRAKGTSRSMNILGLIILSSIIGMATAQVGEIGRPVVVFFQALSAIIIKVLRWIVWFTPLGVASLIASSVAAVDDIEGTFESVGMFALAVSIAMALFLFVLYPTLYFIVTRGNPGRFLFTTIRPLMTAFAPPSSAVAIPDMMYVCEEKHDVDVRISRFVIPFADALNRPGSCSFIFIAAIFLCKLENVDLEVSQYLFIAILTTVSSFAIPSVPSASIISIIIILSSVNIQTSNIGLLMALEWLLDRLRTVVNALSITCAAIAVNTFCKDSLNAEVIGPPENVEITVVNKNKNNANDTKL